MIGIYIIRWDLPAINKSSLLGGVCSSTTADNDESTTFILVLAQCVSMSVTFTMPKRMHVFTSN